MKTKLRIKMRLKLYKDNVLVSDTTKRKKSQISLQLERVSHDMAYIKVSYMAGHNDSVHLTDQSLINTLNIYTEKSLLDFLSEKVGPRG